MPGDSRGFADHSGPHPGGRQQPLPYWTGEEWLLGGRGGGEGWLLGGRGGGGGTTKAGLSLQVSSTLRAGRPDSYLQAFLSLQQSFLCCAFVVALGGGCFLLTALRLEWDQARARAPGTGTLSGTPITYARSGAGLPGASRAGRPLSRLICLFFNLLIRSLRPCYVPDVGGKHGV